MVRRTVVSPTYHGSRPMFDTGARVFLVKTARKRTELGATIFVFFFFAETKMNTETPETNTIENKHGVNTERIQKQNYVLIVT